MKSSAASIAFGALLLLSLGGKLAASAPTPSPDPRLFSAQASALLRGQGFAIAIERRPLGLLVHARRPGCRAMLNDYSPYGTFGEKIGELARPIGPLRFAYRGRLYDDAPKLVPLVDFYLHRELRRIGVDSSRHPIVAVAASPRCDLAGIDWRRLASLQD